MPRRFRTSFAAALALGVLAATLSATVAEAQTVDEIIARNTEARGGQALIDGVQSVRQTSTLVLPGAEATVVVYGKRPNLMRQELTIGGDTAIEAFDGAVAWVVNRMMGMPAPTVLSGTRAQAVRNQANFDGLLVQARTRGDHIEVIGKETIAGKPVHHLRITGADHRVHHCYVDVTTALETRIIHDTEAGRFEQDLLDYQSVDGLKVPFTIKTSLNGRPQGMLTVSKVELNVALDTAMFGMPAK